MADGGFFDGLQISDEVGVSCEVVGGAAAYISDGIIPVECDDRTTSLPPVGGTPNIHHAA